MPKTPLISIIIPTYNRAHIIGETLDSVLSQTYQIGSVLWLMMAVQITLMP